MSEMNVSCKTTRSCKTSDCHHLEGVCCDVKNCAYHDGEHRCTAKEINVGPTYASASHDTACATFKPGTTTGSSNS